MGAPTGTVAPRLTKPWRGYPSVNAVHGVRIHVQQDVSKFVSLGLTPAVGPAGGQVGFGGVTTGQMLHIGTIPLGAMILPVFFHLITGFTPATTPALEVGTRDAAGTFTANILPSTALVTPVFTPSIATGTALGYTASTLELWARLNFTGGPITAGEVDVLVPFYVQKD